MANIIKFGGGSSDIRFEVLRAAASTTKDWTYDGTAPVDGYYYMLISSNSRNSGCGGSLSYSGGTAIFDTSFSGSFSYNRHALVYQKAGGQLRLRCEAGDDSDRRFIHILARVYID